MVFRSGVALYDDAYDKAMRDVAGNTVEDGFHAGKRWSSIWTRDSAYSFDLGSALGRPDLAKNTLRLMTSDDPLGTVWRQDPCRHFGGWPNLTDSIVATVGAWAVYLADGDEEFLRWSFDVTRNSLTRAERDAFEPGSGLFRGCASFMESNSGYPLRYRRNGEAVGHTKALSTNILHYRGYVLAARMGQLLGSVSEQSYLDKAAALRAAINDRLWDSERGRYGYFEDGFCRRSSRMEGLGEALAVLWEVADDEQTARIFRNTTRTAFGIPCLWPQYLEWMFYFADANYYHNGMVWPFVQGYWAWAAASRGEVEIFGAELAHLAGLAARASTFHEFYRPGDGRPDGSARQLWSAAGYLSMIHHGLFGIDADERRIAFRPVVPKGFAAIRLGSYRYRGMVLNLTVTGTGREVQSLTLDDTPRTVHAIPLDLTGAHTVNIVMRED